MRINQLGPFTEPITYKTAVPYPKHLGLVDQGYMYLACSSMQKRTHIVPAPEINDDNQAFLLPYPYRRHTVEGYLNGYRINTILESTSQIVTLTSAPIAGSSLVFVYIPYSIIGGLVSRQDKITLVDTERTLDADELLDSHIFLSISGGGTVTFPALGAVYNGLTVHITQMGTSQVVLMPATGTTILGDRFFTFYAQWVSMDFVYLHEEKMWVPL